jgi:electron transfer flavoprotein alpha subunit
MADRFLAIAGDVGAADLLLGVLPEDVSCEVLVLGSKAGDVEAECSGLPAERVKVAPELSLTSDPDQLGKALGPMFDEADYVLLDSSQAARDLAGWAAASLEAAVVWAVTAVRSVAGVVEADRITLGGSHHLVHKVEKGKAFFLTRGSVPASATRTPAKPPSVEEIKVDSPAPSRIRILQRAGSSDEKIPLQGSRIVLSVGRGIGGPDQIPLYEELASELKAALGASRVVVDSGWLPFSHQVGQTGAAVSPKVYLAFGISGAIQHLAGMRSSAQIVAVNTDREAPICQVADLVVEADANTVAELLLKRVKQSA